MANLRLKLILILVMFAAGINFVSFSFGAEDKILCVVGDDLVTQKDLNEFIALAGIQLSGQYPDKKEFAKKMGQIKNGALDQIIEERMLLQEAKRQKLKIDEKLISERMEEISSQFPSEAEFEQALISDGITLSDAKRKITDQLLIRRAIEENVRSKIYVHPKEVTDYYKEHPEEFNSPESAKLDSIFVSNAESLKKAEEKIENAYKSLKKGDDFSAVAKEYSEGPALGEIRRGQIRKEIEESIFNLKAGEFSQPVKTERGFFIFKLLEITPPQSRPLASVQNEVYRAVFNKKFTARYNEWLQSIKKDVYCVIKK